MIVEDEQTIGAMTFIHRVSDLSVYIKALYEPYTGRLYDQVWDPIRLKDVRKYEETDIPVEEVQPPSIDNLISSSS